MIDFTHVLGVAKYCQYLRRQYGVIYMFCIRLEENFSVFEVGMIAIGPLVESPKSVSQVSLILLVGQHLMALVYIEQRDIMRFKGPYFEVLNSLYRHLPPCKMVRFHKDRKIL